MIEGVYYGIYDIYRLIRNRSLQILGGGKMGVEDVVCKELRSRVEGSVNYVYIDPQELPNIDRNLSQPIRSICLVSAKLKDGLRNDFYVMIPVGHETLGVAVKKGVLTKILTYSLVVEKDFPLVVFVGTIIRGRLPYTIVATDANKGFLRKERVFLPLTGEELDGKIAEQIFKSQNEFIELIDRLNSDEEINLLLKELQGKLTYDAQQKLLEPSPRALYSVRFKHEKEGLVHLIPLGDSIAITVASTPKPTSIPEGLGPWIEPPLYIRQAMEGIENELERETVRELMGRRFVLDAFIPYEFAIQEKLRLLERIATFVQTYKYEGAVKSDYLPKGGISAFVGYIRKPVMGTEVKVDTLLESLSLQLITLLQHKNWRIRAKAAETLGNIKEPKAVGPLIQALKDKKQDVYWRAAYALGEIGDARALEALTQAEKKFALLLRPMARDAIEKIKISLAAKTVCTKCGTEVRRGSSFCTTCGAKLCR
jgi:hypothetical protein